MIPRTGSGRWLAGIAAAVFVLALVSIVVTVLAGREVETLPEGSPERAVQDYLTAIQDRDYAGAYALLGPETQEGCSLSDFEGSVWRPDQFRLRVRLDDVRMTSTGAEVYVRITETFGTQPFPSENTFTERYALIQTDGAWSLRDLGWPVYGCYPARSLAPGTAPAAATSAAQAAGA